MIGPPLPYNVHADMYTVFRNIRPPPLDQFDLRDMTAREAEIREGDLARSDAAIIARANIPSFLFHNLRKFAKLDGIIEM